MTATAAEVLEDQKPNEDQEPLGFGTANQQSVEWEVDDSNFFLIGIMRIISDKLRIQHGGSRAENVVNHCY